jgi:hypothetical protein
VRMTSFGGVDYTTADGTTAELRVPVEGFFNAGSYQCRIYAADNHEVLSRCAKLKVTGERKRYVGQYLFFCNNAWLFNEP